MNEYMDYLLVLSLGDCCFVYLEYIRIILYYPYCATMRNSLTAFLISSSDGFIRMKYMRYMYICYVGGGSQ